jgi:hypothetical protein
MTNTTGLATIKYIYGPAIVNTDHDSVIGSSLQGRIESRIGLPRLTMLGAWAGQENIVDYEVTSSRIMRTCLHLTWIPHNPTPTAMRSGFTVSLHGPSRKLAKV